MNLPSAVTGGGFVAGLLSRRGEPVSRAGDVLGDIVWAKVPSEVKTRTYRELRVGSRVSVSGHGRQGSMRVGAPKGHWTWCVFAPLQVKSSQVKCIIDSTEFGDFPLQVIAHV
jgi:hypothetical protein